MRRKEGLKILWGTSAGRPLSLPSLLFVAFSLEFAEAYSASSSSPLVVFDGLSWGFALVCAFDCRRTFSLFVSFLRQEKKIPLLSGETESMHLDQ